jgi:hypothetical protein
MKEIFSIPYQYINDIGFRESALLLYFMRKISREGGLPGKVLINKKNMCSDYFINFIEESYLDTAIEKLYNFGMVHFHRKAGRKTRIISISVINIIMYELLGRDKYLSVLEEYETKKCCGKIVPYEVIDSLSFAIPEHQSMTSKNYYIDYCSGVDEVIKLVKNMYLFDLTKIQKYIDDGGNYVPKEEKHKNNPVNVFSFFQIGNDVLNFGRPVYNAIMYGAANVKINLGSDNDYSEDDNTEPTLKELARNNYEKYCEYLGIGLTMKKPILDWNSKDFVSYIYCGLAKLNEKDGDFVFPDFAKDCTRMKKLMDKYGNKRLNRVIYLMVKNTNEMIEFCRFKDFKPTPSILSVDWMFDKMLDFASYMDKEKAQKDLMSIINTSVNGNLKKEDDGVKLKELRETFNKNKETK